MWNDMESVVSEVRDVRSSISFLEERVVALEDVIIHIQKILEGLVRNSYGDEA